MMVKVEARLRTKESRRLGAALDDAAVAYQAAHVDAEKLRAKVLGGTDYSRKELAVLASEQSALDRLRRCASDFGAHVIGAQTAATAAKRV